MPIHFERKNQRFLLTTKNTAYAFDIGAGRYLVHTYYGKKGKEISAFEGAPLSFGSYPESLGDKWNPDEIPQECPFFDSGDYRISALRIEGKDGTSVTDFVYQSHRVFAGRNDIPGFPTADADEKTKTLEIKMVDEVTGCVLYLYYTVFYEDDVISRSMKIENKGKDTVTIERCMPISLDMKGCDYHMVSLWGTHNAECNIQRFPLHHGVQSIFSRRGSSSPQHNPFLAVSSPKATETKGDVYAFNLVFSGSFADEIEVDQQSNTRVQVGLGSDTFAYTLEAGETFHSPEALMLYTKNGYGEMSRLFHTFIRKHIMPPCALEKHPVVLNTWEACYFDIDEQTLFAFAEESSKIGIDMLVMDDGWFGARNDDHAGLGDWYPNPEKFKNGMKSFVKGIHERGVKFGIWIEPEMVNQDSDLYRAHPDWCLRVEGRELLLSRDQLVLNMANPDVVAYLKKSFDATFGDVGIDYFKWDMNRHLAAVGSPLVSAEKQKELRYRYVMGVYDLLQYMRARFPDAIIESCSGGGGRYDLGLMKYGFQIWTSDNTDPYARILIQRGARLPYPASTMSCHVSDPHEDMKSLDFRYKVAVGGMLGYELNILKMSEGVKKEIARQIKEYKSFEDLIRLGDYYSLVCPFEKGYAAYYYADKEGTEILFSLLEQENCQKGETVLLRFTAAKADKVYTDVLSGKTYLGSDLKKGVRFSLKGEKFSAEMMHLIAK